MALGRRSRQSRHGGDVPETPGGRRSERDLDSYLAALAPAGAGDGDSALAGRFGTAQVFQLRLPTERIEQLRAVAERRGLAPASLATDWVVERLDVELRRPPA